MKQIDIKNRARSSCLLELVHLMAKEEEEEEEEEEEGENTILAHAGSIRKQVGVTVGVLGVKSLIEHDGEGSVPFSRYFQFCNVSCICNIRAIPTYRVYRLYDAAELLYKDTTEITKSGQ